MAKRKKVDWSRVPWTPFVEASLPEEAYALLPPRERPILVLLNSRYQVAVFLDGDCEPFGSVAHLSIKARDKQAHHDWRDLQRIKNEVCGEECDAVEVYPAESKLVDTANQYHLFVFKDYKLPFGFQTRLVADGDWNGSKQRPFDVRPADCLSTEQWAERYQQVMKGASD